MALAIERRRRDINAVNLGVQQRFDINAIEQNPVCEESNVRPDSLGPADALDDFGVNERLTNQWGKIDMPLLGPGGKSHIISQRLFEQFIAHRALPGAELVLILISAEDAVRVANIGRFDEQ